MTMAASLFLTGCGGSDYTTMSGNGSDNNSGSSNGSGKRVVNVCSWGEYIDEDLIYESRTRPASRSTTRPPRAMKPCTPC